MTRWGRTSRGERRSDFHRRMDWERDRDLQASLHDIIYRRVERVLVNHGLDAAIEEINSNYNFARMYRFYDRVENRLRMFVPIGYSRSHIMDVNPELVRLAYEGAIMRVHQENDNMNFGGLMFGGD